MRKGSTVYIEGQLQTRKWTDQQGVEKYTTEVVLQRYRGELTLLGSRAEGMGAIGSDMGVQSGDMNADPMSPPPMAGGDNLDDDIPF